MLSCYSDIYNKLTFKIFKRTNGKIFLDPAIKNYEPIELKEGMDIKMGTFLKVSGIIIIILTIILLVFSIYFKFNLENYLNDLKIRNREIGFLIEPIGNFINNSINIVIPIVTFLMLIFGSLLFAIGSMYNDIKEIKDIYILRRRYE